MGLSQTDAMSHACLAAMMKDTWTMRIYSCPGKYGTLHQDVEKGLRLAMVTAKVLWLREAVLQ